jgi:hypothetical protein
MTRHVSKLAVELTEPAHAPMVLRRAIAPRCRVGAARW